AGGGHDATAYDGLGGDLLPQAFPDTHDARAYGRLVGMHPGTLVFLHGPLEGPGRWAGVADGLAPGGARVVAPDVVPTSPPFAVGWIAGAARPLHAAEPPEPLVLVGHGTAGPLLPALARTQRAARRQVGGYV